MMPHFLPVNLQSAINEAILLQLLPGSRPVRRLTDALMGALARRRVAQLDRLPAERAQERVLLRLVRHARQTAFGRAHGFDRIASVADYQQRVPLRDYEAFWDGWWR